MFKQEELNEVYDKIMEILQKFEKYLDIFIMYEYHNSQSNNSE